MAASTSELCKACAQGDLERVKSLIQDGCDVNQRLQDGMTPLSISAFWGYADITRSLLENGANINTINTGTKWTPLHCAAFQGHGPVIMRLMMHNPDLTHLDTKSRTASDFASAMDSIWPFFADAGCKRTSKQKLIEMEIVQKVTHSEPDYSRGDLAHFSRPGSSYAMRAQGPSYANPNMEVAAITGDVLAAMPEEPFTNGHPSLVSWNNAGYYFFFNFVNFLHR